jgi:hypothetical protein
MVRSAVGLKPQRVAGNVGLNLRRNRAWWSAASWDNSRSGRSKRAAEKEVTWRRA